MRTKLNSSYAQYLTFKFLYYAMDRKKGKFKR